MVYAENEDSRVDWEGNIIDKRDWTSQLVIDNIPVDGQEEDMAVSLVGVKPMN